ncbi:MAG: sulfatase [Halorientalis sp.]
MSAARSNVLFVCVDAMRSDFALGDYGSEKSLFEFFEREGTVFDTTVAAASTTSPCVASYMTGNYPSDHGILSLTDFRLDERATTLAEVYRDAGYDTAAHVTGPITADTGLDAGFEEYEHREEDRTVYTDWYEDLKADVADTDGPWFRYVHLWEAHIPKDLPPDADPDELEYEAAVRGVAERLEELLEVVDLDDTIVAMTGDHGESVEDGTLRNRAVLALDRAPIPFTDAYLRNVRRSVYDEYLRPRGIEPEGFYNSLRRFSAVDFPNALHAVGHGYHVYDFLTRVPFVLAGAGVPADGRVSEQVRQVDLFPTLLSAAGVEPPAAVAGQDLLDGDVEHRPAYTRACGAVLRSKENWLDGVRYDGWKFVKGRERSLRQLFDLEADPEELDNVVDEYPEKAAELEAIVDEFVAREEQVADREIDADAEARMTERLEDLGYL